MKLFTQFKKDMHLYKTRFSFGATASIITNLAMIVGFRTGTDPKSTIISGILVVALADNISDSLAIHIHQEASGLAIKEVWFSTFVNFLTRILISMTFMGIILLCPIKVAVLLSIIWGLFILAYVSYTIAEDRKTSALSVISEHLLIAIAVIFFSNYLGEFIVSLLKNR